MRVGFLVLSVLLCAVHAQQSGLGLEVEPFSILDDGGEPIAAGLLLSAPRFHSSTFSGIRVSTANEGTVDVGACAVGGISFDGDASIVCADVEGKQIDVGNHAVEPWYTLYPLNAGMMPGHAEMLLRGSGMAAHLLSERKRTVLLLSVNVTAVSAGNEDRCALLRGVGWTPAVCGNGQSEEYYSACKGIRGILAGGQLVATDADGCHELPALTMDVWSALPASSTAEPVQDTDDWAHDPTGRPAVQYRFVDPEFAVYYLERLMHAEQINPQSLEELRAYLHENVRLGPHDKAEEVGWRVAKVLRRHFLGSHDSMMSAFQTKDADGRVYAEVPRSADDIRVSRGTGSVLQQHKVGGHLSSFLQERVTVRKHHDPMHDHALRVYEAVEHLMHPAVNVNFGNSTREDAVLTHPSVDHLQLHCPAEHTGVDCHHRIADASREIVPVSDRLSLVELDSYLGSKTSSHVSAGFIIMCVLEGISPNAVKKAVEKIMNLIDDKLIPILADIMAGSDDPKAKDTSGGKLFSSSLLETVEQMKAFSKDAPAGAFLEARARAKGGGGGKSGMIKGPGLLAKMVVKDLLDSSHSIIELVASPVAAIMVEDLAPFLDHHIRDPLTQSTTKAVLNILVRSLPLTLPEVIPDALTQLLPPLLISSITGVMHNTLTRALTHSLVPTIDRGLRYSPTVEHACYMCKEFNTQCEQCFGAYGVNSTTNSGDLKVPNVGDGWLDSGAKDSMGGNGKLLQEAASDPLRTKDRFRAYYSYLTEAYLSDFYSENIDNQHEEDAQDEKK